MAKPENPTSETEEHRDADEVAEEERRGGLSYALVPIGENGKPMRRIKVGVSDKVPTVQFGNVVLTVEMEEWVENTGSGPEGRQQRIDVGRELHRDAQVIVGMERRALQWAMDPSLKVASPITGDERFAAPPTGYDATTIGTAGDPAHEIAARAAAAQAEQQAAGTAAPSTPPPAAPAPPAPPVPPATN